RRRLRHTSRRPPRGGEMGRRTATTLAPLVIVALVLSSCSTIENNPKAVLGTVIGAGAGAGIAALAGGGGGAIAGAAIGGALIGGFIGNRLAARGKRMAAQAAPQARGKNPAGEPPGWDNPETR